MPSATTTDARRRRANEAYWSSEETVDQIAERLGMSRGALYATLEPAPAGAVCPVCGGALTYANRSARSAGRAVCAACGAEATLTPQAGAAEPDALEAGAAVVAVEPPAASRLEQLREGLAGVSPERAAMIGGAAALGVAVGAAAARAVRKRS